VQKLVGFLINALLGALINRIQLWWAARQAAYYKQEAEVAKQKLDSLKTGMTVEASVLAAAAAVAADAEKKRSDNAALMAELLERAKRRKGEANA
jgi:hypothetical protein